MKSGTPTRRYVGSIRTTGTSGQCEDSETKRLVWNYHNRLRRRVRRREDGVANWTYTTATWRQANGNAANQIAVLVGLAEAMIHVILDCAASNTNTGVLLNIGIAVDRTDGTDTGGGVGHTALANAGVPLTVTLVSPLALGYHYIAWTEMSAATGTTTFYGAAFVGYGTGLEGWYEC